MNIVEQRENLINEIENTDQNLCHFNEKKKRTIDKEITPMQCQQSIGLKVNRTMKITEGEKWERDQKRKSGEW